MTNNEISEQTCKHNKVPEQCPLCVDAARKRKDRAAAKLAKEATAKVAEVNSYSEYWPLNRSSWTPLLELPNQQKSKLKKVA